MLQPVPFDLAYNSKYFQAASPAALELAVNTALITEAGSGHRVVGIGLAGAGDGQQFSARIDYILSGGTPVPSLQVECYEAATPDALLQEFVTRTTATRTAGTNEVYDHLEAGSAKGDRFMGMIVMALPGSYPGDGSSSGGFGFGIGAAPLVLGADLVFSAAIQAASPADDPALDSGTNPDLFALGTAADLGKLKYVGTQARTFVITVDIDSELTAAGPADVQLNLLISGVTNESVLSTESNGTLVNTSVTVIRELQPGDLIDVSSNSDITVRRYHVVAQAA